MLLTLSVTDLFSIQLCQFEIFDIYTAVFSSILHHSIGQVIVLRSNQLVPTKKLKNRRALTADELV